MIIGWNGWKDLALELVTFMIILAGIVYGIGVALASAKLKRFGSEELVQGIINAMIVGGIVTIIAILNPLSSGFFTQNQCGSANESIQWVGCIYSNLSSNLSITNQELVLMSRIVGYYQSIVLNFNNNASSQVQSLQIQPLKNLDGVLMEINGDLVSLNLLNMGLGINSLVFSFIGSVFMGFLFPFGLILRSFFMTRKLGGFLIAVSIGLFIVYPLFILPFSQPSKEINDVNDMLSDFTDGNVHPGYSTIPLVDLNSNNAIAERLDNLSYSGSGNDFIGDITLILGEVSHVIGILFGYIFLVPLFSLAVTFVFIREMYIIMSGEFRIGSWFGWL